MCLMLRLTSDQHRQLAGSLRSITTSNSSVLLAKLLALFFFVVILFCLRGRLSSLLVGSSGRHPIIAPLMAFTGAIFPFLELGLGLGGKKQFAGNLTIWLSFHDVILPPVVPSARRSKTEVGHEHHDAGYKEAGGHKLAHVRPAHRHPTTRALPDR